MNNRRKVEITIETHEIKIIRVNGKRQEAFCNNCRCDTGILSVAQFAFSFRLSSEEITRRINTAEIHLVNEERGAALICCNSFERSSWK